MNTMESSERRLRTDADRARVRSDAEIATSVIGKAWPLESFIAVNPLGALEGEPFEDAIRVAGRTLGARGTMSEGWFRKRFESGRIEEGDLRTVLRRHMGSRLASGPLRVGRERFSPEAILMTDLLVGEETTAPVRNHLTAAESTEPHVLERTNRECGKWCAAYLGHESAGWAMPGREKGFYPAWRDLVGLDRSLPSEARRILSAQPERPEDALLDALETIGVPSHAIRDYLRSHIGAMPGWAALISRVSENDRGIDPVAWLAVRVATESALLQAAGVSLPVPYIHPVEEDDWRAPPERSRTVQVLTALGALPGSNQEELGAIDELLAALPSRMRTHIWLEAYEENYRASLLRSLEATPEKRDRPRPDAQLVCCIDVRSEGLRRRFESLGNYETLGFAGFFGFPIDLQDLEGNRPVPLCPVLIEPKGTVNEEPMPGSEERARARLARQAATGSAREGIHAAETGVVTPFALAEMSGWIKGPISAARTLAPGRFGSIRNRLRGLTSPEAPTTLDVARDMPLEQRVLFAEVALRTMGLVRGFAPVVVLCGHGSTTENNPYASALDCGACGGHRGGPNARAAATVLNDPAVRNVLEEKGIPVPADTLFVAAEHDTTTDRIEILDREQIPGDRDDAVAKIAADLGRAGDALSLERIDQLPGGSPGRAEAAAAGTSRRSRDWAEVYPEWGLAGNAAFIIGPRSMTRGLDLGRRTFLHSYEPDLDPGGEALETILTAPVVVAQWINCQYYFSAVEPSVFGAGTKVTHNPVGRMGVLSGPDGDLKLGLPWQSVAEGEHLVHEPMRLLVVVEAPLDRVESVLGRNPSVRELFDNGWLGLAARESAASRWMRRERNGGWNQWEVR